MRRKSAIITFTTTKCDNGSICPSPPGRQLTVPHLEPLPQHDVPVLPGFLLGCCIRLKELHEYWRQRLYLLQPAPFMFQSFCIPSHNLLNCSGQLLFNLRYHEADPSVSVSMSSRNCIEPVCIVSFANLSTSVSVLAHRFLPLFDPDAFNYANPMHQVHDIRLVVLNSHTVRTFPSTASHRNMSTSQLRIHHRSTQLSHPLHLWHVNIPLIPKFSNTDAIAGHELRIRKREIREFLICAAMVRMRLDNTELLANPLD